MSKDFKVLFLGDMVGRPGRRTACKYLNINRQNYDFVIANVENASHGFGLTFKNHNELLNTGINCMTSGNHIWDKKDIFSYIDESPAIIRPLNYTASDCGVGYREFLDGKVIVINLLGKVFIDHAECPFSALKNLSEKLDFNNKIVILDFHAEATAEKECMGYFAQGLGVKAVFGTHTHVQTADEKILSGTTAYISDVGFVGGTGGVIGMNYQISLNRLITDVPERFDVVVSKNTILNGVSVVFDLETGYAKQIERIKEEYKGECDEA